MYAYGPISDVVAKRFQAQIVDEGAGLIESDNAATKTSEQLTRYTSPTGMPGGYAFGDGYWAYALDNGGGSYLEEVVENAPAF